MVPCGHMSVHEASSAFSDSKCFFLWLLSSSDLLQTFHLHLRHLGPWAGSTGADTAAAPCLYPVIPRGHCEGTARRDCLFPLVRAHCGCSWEPGPKERRMFSLPMCLQLLLPVLVKRSPRVKNDNLCTLLITLPFHGKMVVTFPSWQQQNPPSDLAGSDLEV